MIQLRRRRHLLERTPDLDSYTAAVSLATIPGWTLRQGAFLTVAGGTIKANSATMNVAEYNHPAGFTTTVNHESEITLSVSGGVAGSIGCCVATQANGACYYVYGAADNNATGFGRVDAAGSVLDSDFQFPTGGVPIGTKLRISVTGVGTARRVTASWNNGNALGWVTPALWLNRDFGVYLDGGRSGIGAGNISSMLIASFTTRNI